MRYERRKEEARSNKQQGKATQHTQDGVVVPTGVDCYVVFLQLVCVCVCARVCVRVRVCVRMCVCMYIEFCVCRGTCIYLLEVRWYFFLLLYLHVYTSTVTKYTKEGREKSYQTTWKPSKMDTEMGEIRLH